VRIVAALVRHRLQQMRVSATETMRIKLMPEVFSVMAERKLPGVDMRLTSVSRDFCGLDMLLPKRCGETKYYNHVTLWYVVVVC
jgi:hypothetical protein